MPGSPGAKAKTGVKDTCVWLRVDAHSYNARHRCGNDCNRACAGRLARRNGKGFCWSPIRSQKSLVRKENNHEKLWETHCMDPWALVPVRLDCRGTACFSRRPESTQYCGWTGGRDPDSAVFRLARGVERFSAIRVVAESEHADSLANVEDYRLCVSFVGSTRSATSDLCMARGLWRHFYWRNGFA